MFDELFEPGAVDQVESVLPAGKKQLDLKAQIVDSFSGVGWVHELVFDEVCKVVHHMAKYLQACFFRSAPKFIYRRHLNLPLSPDRNEAPKLSIAVVLRSP